MQLFIFIFGVRWFRIKAESPANVVSGTTPASELVDTNVASTESADAIKVTAPTESADTTTNSTREEHPQKRKMNILGCERNGFFPVSESVASNQHPNFMAISSSGLDRRLQANETSLNDAELTETALNIRKVWDNSDLWEITEFEIVCLKKDTAVTGLNDDDLQRFNWLVSGFEREQKQELKDSSWSVAFGLCVYGFSSDSIGTVHTTSVGLKKTAKKVGEWFKQFLP